MGILINHTYSFKELEEFFNTTDIWSNSVCLRVKSFDDNGKHAIMHVFQENFSSAYKSGDGVLFYQDGEAHSANPMDLFTVLDIILIKPSSNGK